MDFEEGPVTQMEGSLGVSLHQGEPTAALFLIHEACGVLRQGRGFPVHGTTIHKKGEWFGKKKPLSDLLA